MSNINRLTEQHVVAINTVSRFLAHQQTTSPIQCPPVDEILLCASAVLPVTEHVFSALETRPELAKYLVICGGIGHSTRLLYDSVARHPLYRSMANSMDGLPEARVLEMVLEKYYASASMTRNGMKILIEDKSTNCGANALETRKLLEAKGVKEPDSILIVQDPTMSLRTLASFEKVYEGLEVELRTCPTLVPQVKLDRGEVVWDIPGLKAGNLWAMDRFFDLIMGEVPRLRDDENGYGPSGKGYISHVKMPDEVQEAHRSLHGVLQNRR
jgi:uncharacterized SAM-binding protein YcdF (DUF218 family)